MQTARVWSSLFAQGLENLNFLADKGKVNEIPGGQIRDSIRRKARLFWGKVKRETVVASTLGLFFSSDSNCHGSEVSTRNPVSRHLRNRR